MTTVSLSPPLAAQRQLIEKRGVAVGRLSLMEKVVLVELLGHYTVDLLLQGKVKKALLKEIEKLLAALGEIQKNLSQRNWESLPLCKAWIEENREASQNDHVLFLGLKGKSYRILPYPQRARLTGGVIEVVAGVEIERERGLSEIERLLAGVVEDDEKEEEVEALEKQSLLVQTLWGRAALGSDMDPDSSPISYADMLVTWGKKAGKSADAARVFQATRFTHWVRQNGSEIEVFPFQGSSYRETLVEAALSSLEKAFSEIPKGLREEIRARCVKDESFRSDLAYFSQFDLSIFDGIDFFSTFPDKPKSEAFFSGLQLFSYLQKHGPKKERLPTLFSLCARFLRPLPNFFDAEFATRGSRCPGPHAAEEVEEAFLALENIAKGVLKKTGPFFRGKELSEEEEAFLASPKAVSLFLLLFHKAARSVIGECFSIFQEVATPNLGLFEVYDFCCLNIHFFSAPGAKDLFLEYHRPFEEALSKLYPDRKGMEKLCIVPSLDLRPLDRLEALSNAAPKLGMFSEKISPYQELLSQQSDEVFFLFFRKFLCHSAKISFFLDLLQKDAAFLGFSPKSLLLLEQIFTHASFYRGKIEATDLERKQMRKVVAPVAAHLALSPFYTFRLYLEGLNWREEEREASYAIALRESVQSIGVLQKFCPAFPEPLLFDLLSHPRLTAYSPLEPLFSFWTKWAISPEVQRALFIAPSQINAVWEVIRQALQLLVSGIPNLERQVSDLVGAAFFPFWQPLVDAMSLLQPEPEEHLETHVGRVFFPTVCASQGIYLDWEKEGNGLRLWILSVHLREKTAAGGSLYFFANPEHKEQVLSFFQTVAPLLFREELTCPESYDLSSNSEEEAWKKATPELGKAIAGYSSFFLPPEVEGEAWKFLYAAKKLYRSSFFPKTFPMPNAALSALQIAGIGRVYPTVYGPALVPEEWLLDEMRSCWLAESLEEALVEATRKLFSESTEEPLELGRTLQVTEDGALIDTVPVLFQMRWLGGNVSSGVFLVRLIAHLKNGQRAEVPLQYRTEWSQERFAQHLFLHLAWLKSRYYRKLRENADG